MRILMVTEVFYPVIGGAGKFVYTTAANLAKRGHRVSVLTRMTKGAASQENIDGIEVYRIAWPNNFLIQLFSVFNINRFIKRFLIKNPLDLIVFNQPFSAFCAYSIKSLRDTPNIYHFHSSWFEEFQVKHYIQEIKLNSLLNILRLIIFSPVSFIMRCIEGFVISRCDKIIAASEYSREKLVKFYNINDNKIMIIPGCVDTDRFKPVEDKAGLRDNLGIPKESYVLITARNLVERMGIDNLIFAFYNLSCLYKDLYLVIAGEGRLKNKLISLVKELDIGDLVKFTGRLNESELVQYYQASDLFILPTKYIEHFGLVTIEAFATGMPVLGTPVGGTVEILNKFNKEFLFQGTDFKSITQGIIRFLDKYRNIDLKNSCREFAIKEYSLNKIIDQTEKFYLSLVKG
ncbi:MAG: glycosyltransferase family 4 protein [Candidatus Omnitrophica bacterium]|nr:glycosyltransferase family 4 protein [Candidatus Omnitrophota bacterium]